MTNVERVRDLCQKLNVPVSKLENDLGFGNGYLNPKKIKDIKMERLMMILDYLGVSLEEFWNIGSPKTQKIETSLAQIKKESPEVYESIMDSWTRYSSLVEKYKELDEHGRQVVDAVINIEAKRSIAEMDDVRMVARGGKKLPPEMKGELEKMLKIIYSEEEE